MTREWPTDWCPVCDRKVSVRTDGYFRVHGPVGRGCKGAQYQASPVTLAALGLADTATVLASLGMPTPEAPQ